MNWDCEVEAMEGKDERFDAMSRSLYVVRSEVRPFIVVQDLQTIVVCDRAKQHGQRCYALVRVQDLIIDQVQWMLLQVMVYERASCDKMEEV